MAPPLPPHVFQQRQFLGAYAILDRLFHVVDFLGMLAVMAWLTPLDSKVAVHVCLLLLDICFLASIVRTRAAVVALHLTPSMTAWRLS